MKAVQGTLFSCNMLIFLLSSFFLQDYLTGQGLSEQDLLQKCLQKLDSKEYTSVGE